jgi:hypothetical protein
MTGVNRASSKAVGSENQAVQMAALQTTQSRQRWPVKHIFSALNLVRLTTATSVLYT